MHSPAARPRSRAAAARAAVLAFCILAVVQLAACSAGPPGARARPGNGARTPAGWSRLGGLRAGPLYYLSLGDSLAQGVQPAQDGASASTGAGYPDLLASQLRTQLSRLRLIRLGCTGETSATMIHGGSCPYQAGSQLAEAVRTVRAHAGHVALVTIDIGANDPNSCVLQQSLATMPRCLSAEAAATTRNLATIMSRLRSAAGRRVLIIGMTYYVPELAEWLAGQTGAEFAVISERLVSGYNRLLTRQYQRFGARVADVFTAFRSADFGGRVRLARGAVAPRNVAAICSLTWMCAAPPRGPNEHANAAGYRVIARAFWRTIMS